MRQYMGLEQIRHEEDDLRGGALTIGNFDGVHLGHRRILEELVRAARRFGGPAVAVTFDPPPAAVLRPQQAGGRLTPINERLRLIAHGGLDATVVVRPDPTFLSMGAEVFVERVIAEQFAARAVVEGPAWRFGHDRAGDVGLLARLADRYDYRVVLVRPLQARLDNGKPVAISSTLIRWLLAAGDVAQANRLLGRPYTLFGQVGKGSAAGKPMGFPTLNLRVADQAIPGDGIYAGLCKVGSRLAPAAVHIGPAPTLGRLEHAVEAHLLAGDVGDLYGEAVALECRQRLRDVVHYPTKAELVAQMHKDVEQVRQLAQTW